MEISLKAILFLCTLLVTSISNAFHPNSSFQVSKNISLNFEGSQNNEGLTSPSQIPNCKNEHKRSRQRRYFVRNFMSVFDPRCGEAFRARAVTVYAGSGLRLTCDPW